MSALQSDKIFTIPNGLSVLRLLGVPIFFWQIVAVQQYGWAVLTLAASGATDWLDGYLARRLNQQSRFGAMLDPLADRLYIVAALVALALTQVLPIAIITVLVVRDLYMTALLALLKRRGFSGFPVHFVGKAATMNLLYALPLVLLGTFTGTIGQISYVIGWAFLLWGIAMYWYGALLYTAQYRSLIGNSGHE